jgi:hypothetical protein
VINKFVEIDLPDMLASSYGNPIKAFLLEFFKEIDLPTELPQHTYISLTDNKKVAHLLLLRPVLKKPRSLEYKSFFNAVMRGLMENSEQRFTGIFPYCAVCSIEDTLIFFDHVNKIDDQKIKNLKDKFCTIVQREFDITPKRCYIWDENGRKNNTSLGRIEIIYV